MKAGTIYYATVTANAYGSSSAEYNTNVLPTGSWTHLAVTIPYGGTATVYINGAVSGTFSVSSKTFSDIARPYNYIGLSTQSYGGVLGNVLMLQATVAEAVRTQQLRACFRPKASLYPPGRDHDGASDNAIMQSSAPCRWSPML